MYTIIYIIECKGNKGISKILPMEHFFKKLQRKIKIFFFLQIFFRGIYIFCQTKMIYIYIQR